MATVEHQTQAGEGGASYRGVPCYGIGHIPIKPPSPALEKLPISRKIISPLPPLSVDWVCISLLGWVVISIK